MYLPYSTTFKEISSIAPPLSDSGEVRAELLVQPSELSLHHRPSRRHQQVHHNKRPVTKRWDSPKEGGIKRIAVILQHLCATDEPAMRGWRSSFPNASPASYHQQSIKSSPIMACITRLAPPRLLTFVPTHAALLLHQRRGFARICDRVIPRGLP